MGTNNLSDNFSVGQSAGKLNNAAHFALANTQFLSIANNNTLNFGDQDFSVATWVYFDSIATNEVLVGHWSPSANDRSWNLNYDLSFGKFRFIVFDNTNSTNMQVRTTDTISVNTWYFVVAWHDSVNNTLNIQVNNGTVSSVSWAGGVRQSNADFIVGAAAGTTNNFYTDGRIDGLGLWTKVLSSDERTTLYNSGSGVEYPFPETITISTPSAYQVIQRNGSNQANIAITGTYTGTTPPAIEASWNGGAYTTIASSPSGGTYSGTLSAQSAGQGTLTVRRTDDTTVSASKSYVGIGDVFCHRRTK